MQSLHQRRGARPSHRCRPSPESTHRDPALIGYCQSVADRPDRDPGPPDEPATLEPGPVAPSRRRRRSGATEVIGNALVGFDYAIYRSTKPPAILVEAAKPVRGLSGEGGHLLSIDFPDDVPDPAVSPLASEDGPE